MKPYLSTNEPITPRVSRTSLSMLADVGNLKPEEDVSPAETRSILESDKTVLSEFA